MQCTPRPFVEPVQVFLCLHQHLVLEKPFVRLVRVFQDMNALVFHALDDLAEALHRALAQRRQHRFCIQECALHHVEGQQLVRTPEKPTLPFPQTLQDRTHAQHLHKGIDCKCKQAMGVIHVHRCGNTCASPTRLARRTLRALESLGSRRSARYAVKAICQ